MKKYAEITKSNQSKIENSYFHKTVKAMLDFIDVYPPSVMTKINDDKKLRKISVMADPVYKLQSSFGSTVNDIKSSIILASNENVIPHFIDEMAMFAAKFKYLLEEKDKLKSSQELNAYYKDLKLKQKDIKDSLVSDLKQFSESFDIGIDIKQAIIMFDILSDKHYLTLTLKRSFEDGEKSVSKHLSLIDKLYEKSKQVEELLVGDTVLDMVKKTKISKRNLKNHFIEEVKKLLEDSSVNIKLSKADILNIMK
ncbi:hypothetical protein DC914_RS24350 [Vibrio parahaemolyticus]|nr:hypothetical protein [Vibrio parahaemolyticus]HAT8520008.1 hypothetical protein [Vibrio vulnificus]EGR2988105.1 hypothetical protein [Vibrio parahaemolyticus]EGR3229960.1 hypothetical protein [Vibrio parahaemolyticus]EGR3309658.1 hypothetical protein [Vibrio parahaemolyticus]